MSSWLTIRRGSAPLVLSIPHAGIDIPADIERRLSSNWLARKDADWCVDRLYEAAAPADATIVRTPISRTVIDVNRDPSGASLYPGRRPRSCARPRPLTASHFTETACCLIRPKSMSVPHAGSDRTTRRSRPNLIGCGGATNVLCSTTATRYVRSSRACSTASCPTSILAPTTGQAVRLRDGCRRSGMRRDVA